MIFAILFGLHERLLQGHGEGLQNGSLWQHKLVVVLAVVVVVAVILVHRLGRVVRRGVLNLRACTPSECTPSPWLAASSRRVFGGMQAVQHCIQLCLDAL